MWGHNLLTWWAVLGLNQLTPSVSGNSDGSPASYERWPDLP
jgi:hypothetical protein